MNKNTINENNQLDLMMILDKYIVIFYKMKNLIQNSFQFKKSTDKIEINKTNENVNKEYIENNLTKIINETANDIFKHTN